MVDGRRGELKYTTECPIPLLLEDSPSCSGDDEELIHVPPD